MTNFLPSHLRAFSDRASAETPCGAEGFSIQEMKNDTDSTPKDSEAEKFKEYRRKYNNSPKGRAANKAYREMEKVKAKKKAYSASEHGRRKAFEARVKRVSALEKEGETTPRAYDPDAKRKRKEWRLSEEGREAARRAERKRKAKYRLTEKWKANNRRYKAAWRARFPQTREEQEKAVAYAREYRKTATYKASIAKYRSSPEAKAAQRIRGANKRAMKAKASVGDLSVIKSWEMKWRKSKSVKCYWCGGITRGKFAHADHIVALKLGGGHEIGNLCVSCASCNLRKKAKTVEQWNRFLAQPVLVFREQQGGSAL